MRRNPPRSLRRIRSRSVRRVRREIKAGRSSACSNSAKKTGPVPVRPDRTHQARIAGQCLLKRRFDRFQRHRKSGKRPASPIAQRNNQGRALVVIHLRMMLLHSPIVGNGQIAPGRQPARRTFVTRRPKVEVMQKTAHEHLMGEGYRQSQLL